MPTPIVLATKDPNEIKRYEINWNAGPHGQPGILQSLGNDTITGTPTWIYPAGITGASESNTTTTTRTLLSGGTHGNDYTITCRITTLGGETLEQAFTVPVREKDK